MEHARRHFLARAGRAGDQHARAGRRDLLDRRAQLRRSACEPPISSVSGAGAQPQLAVLAPQPRRLERARDDQQQPVGLERLLDEVVGAAAGSPAPPSRWCRGRRSSPPARAAPRGAAPRGCPGRRAREFCSQMSRITSDGRRARKAASAASLLCGLRGSRSPRRAGCPSISVADVGLVVDDQDVMRHARAFAPSRGPGRHRPAGRPPPAPDGQRPASTPRAAAPSGRSSSTSLPAMVLHDLLHDGKAEPGALRLVRHIGLGQAVAVLVLRQADCRRPRRRRSPACVGGSTRDVAMMRPAGRSSRRRASRPHRRRSAAGWSAPGRSAGGRRAPPARGSAQRRRRRRSRDARRAAGTAPRAPARPTSSGVITGCGMRAKAENSSTMRPMSPTWRTMVSVQAGRSRGRR